MKILYYRYSCCIGPLIGFPIITTFVANYVAKRLFTIGQIWRLYGKFGVKCLVWSYTASVPYYIVKCKPKLSELFLIVFCLYIYFFRVTERGKEVSGDDFAEILERNRTPYVVTKVNIYFLLS